MLSVEGSYTIEVVEGDVARLKMTSMVAGKVIEVSFNLNTRNQLVDLRLATIAPITEEEFSIISPAVGSLGFYADYVKDSKMAILTPSVGLKGLRGVDDVKRIMNSLTELVEEMSKMGNSPLSNIEISLILTERGWLIDYRNGEMFKVLDLKGMVASIYIRLKGETSFSIAEINVSLIRPINRQCIVKRMSELGFSNIEDYEYMIKAVIEAKTLGLLTLLAEKAESLVMDIVKGCS